MRWSVLGIPLMAGWLHALPSPGEVVLTPRGAWLTFSVRVSGDSVVLDSLPHPLEEDRLRFQGAGVRVEGWRLESIPAPPPPVQELATLRRELTRTLHSLEDSAEARNQALQAINRYAASEIKSVEELQAYVNLLLEHKPVLRAERRALRDRLKDVSERLRQIPDIPSRMSRLILFTRGEGALRVQVFTPRAGFAPGLRLRVDPHTGQVTLIREVEVWQNTGWTWRDVPFLLTTREASWALGDPPPLSPWEPLPHSPPRRRSLLRSAPAQEFRVTPSPEAKAGAGGDLQVRFARKTLPPFRSLRWSVDSQQTTGRVFVEVRPQEDLRGWLAVHVTNPFETALPGGEVQMEVAGTWSGRGEIAPWPAGTDRVLRVAELPEVRAGFRKLARKTGRFLKEPREVYEAWAVHPHGAPRDYRMVLALPSWISPQDLRFDPRPDSLLQGDPPAAVWWRTLAAGETLRVQIALPERRVR